MITKKKALVVLSGGQDSTTCLFWALKEFGGTDFVESVTFDYGQRHRREIESASKIAQIAGITNSILPINTFSTLSGNSLTDMSIAVTDNDNSGLPNSFVPGRNLIFLTYAAAFAYSRGISELVTGVSQTDYSGYPDCRADTMRALNLAINLGMEQEFTIHTPLMYKSKAETVMMAVEYGAIDALAWSHTCYNGSFPPCGSCPACRIRAEGFAEAGIADPIWQRQDT